MSASQSRWATGSTCRWTAGARVRSSQLQSLVGRWQATSTACWLPLPQADPWVLRQGNSFSNACTTQLSYVYNLCSGNRAVVAASPSPNPPPGEHANRKVGLVWDRGPGIHCVGHAQTGLCPICGAAHPLVIQRCMISLDTPSHSAGKV